MKQAAATFISGMVLLVSVPASASSDYLLEIGSVKGEVSAPVSTQVDSWSFGVCNAGQCSTIVSPRDAASGQASGKAAGKGRPSSASWDLATGKGARMAGSASGEAPPTAAQSQADLASVATQSEVSAFTLVFQKITFENRSLCDSGRIVTGRLRSDADSFELSGVQVSCSTSSGSPENRAMLGLRGARVASPDCSSGKCPVVADGLLVMRLSGGQMKNSKTGHVTLLK